MKSIAANALWLAACAPEHFRFRRAVKRVRAEQEAILRRVLAANAATEFGKSHGFASIRTAREYRQNVPLRKYDEFRDWIVRAADGIPNVLTREPVRLLQPTSGSTSERTKLIPYTSGLAQEFQAGIRAWIADLFLHDPAAMAGQAYWSVSPVTSCERKTPGGVPLGFEDDTAYVGGWQHSFVQAVQAVPGAVRAISGIEQFHYVTLYFLLRSRTLALVSVWNPSFFTSLVARLPEWGEDLARDLQRGTIRDAHSLPHGIHQRFRADTRRADRLRTALRMKTPAEMHRALWPRLRWISCWADGNASGPAATLSRLFPQARMQPKGLIATEGFVSLPVAGCDGGALALRSHFFEFLPLNADGELLADAPQLAHELEYGRKYSVVLTTSGGLYRYRLDDLIEVIGHWRECPMIRFVGRHGHVSDWFGEKLDEAHVAAVFHQTFTSLGISPAFAMLACDAESPLPGYVLYLDADDPDRMIEAAARKIESGLRENFHYDYARKLEQLAAVRIARVSGGAERYLAARTKQGRRPGDVKPVALDGGAGWAGVFCSDATLHSSLPRPVSHR